MNEVTVWAGSLNDSNPDVVGNTRPRVEMDTKPVVAVALGTLNDSDSVNVVAFSSPRDVGYPMNEVQVALGMLNDSVNVALGMLNDS